MNKLLLLLLMPSLLFAGEIKPKSTVKEVTVYLNGAQVTSESSVTLPQGVTEVLLTDLSPLIDQNSIQVSGLKNASILSISYAVNYIAKKVDTEKTKLLEADVAEKWRRHAMLQNQIRGLREEEALLITNKKLNGEQQSLTIGQVAAFAKYYRERHAAIQTEIYDATIASTKLSQQINDVTQELSKLLNENRKQRGEILVKIDAPAAVTLNLITKYTVSQAGWFPIYDIKTQGVKQPLDIFYKAHVYQQTGEDWNNVKVTLSTGDPNINNLKPDVQPQYLNFVQTRQAQASAVKSYSYKFNPTIKKVGGVVLDSQGMPLPGVIVQEQGTSNAVSTDFDGRYTLNINSGQNLSYSFMGMLSQVMPVYSQQMNVTMVEDVTMLEAVVVGYDRKSKTEDLAEMSTAAVTIETTGTGDVKEMGVTNAVFKIAKPYTIPSTEEINVLTIDQFTLPIVYEYFTAPLLNQNVFLTAKLKEWEKFDLLPGEANIYFEGSYAGKTFIDPLQTTEELTISLGVDPAVIVERKQVEDLKAKSFLGGTRIINKNYEITIRNNKTTDIEVVLMDRIPVSQNKEIKIEDVNTGGAQYDEKKGLLTWKLNLKAKESVKKQLSYIVKYPKERRVNF